MTEAEKLRQYADACFASCYPPVDAVVQAILAERERCAKIAESVVVGKPTYLRDEHRKPKTPSLTRQAIALAIRRGTP